MLKADLEKEVEKLKKLSVNQLKLRAPEMCHFCQFEDGYYLFETPKESFWTCLECGEILMDILRGMGWRN